jgi:hypothetical protein
MRSISRQQSEANISHTLDFPLPNMVRPVQPCTMKHQMLLDDPKHWLSRAEEIRALAQHIADKESQRTMLNIAQDYEVLAARAEQRATRSKRGT